jgi:glutamate synthase (NADPH/NADH) large chain
VRNSGAVAVVEGVGDHGCEYMTGGKVVVLGPTGRNFGAGMSGGVAYVYDPDRTFGERFNPEMVDAESLDAADRDWLHEIVARHGTETESAVAARILAAWERSAEDFVKVMPRDYRRVLEATRRAEAEGRSVDEAVMSAAHG